MEDGFGEIVTDTGKKIKDFSHHRFTIKVVAHHSFVGTSQKNHSKKSRTLEQLFIIISIIISI